MKPSIVRAVRQGWIVVFCVLFGACDRAPAAESLPEWTPADHDQEPGRPPPANAGPRTDAGGAAAMVEITWRNQCSTCHGPTGHGDGPQGPMFKAPDLTREGWSPKDEEIAGAIKNGKGRMPKFDLPDDVVRGLVARIRSFRGH